MMIKIDQELIKAGNDLLWKYLDIHKFLHFINTKSLFLTRLDKFEDVYEGITEELLLKKRISHDFASRGISEVSKVLDYSYDIKITELQRSQFVNCWFKSSRESVGMWNLYSNSDSVAICLKTEQLLKYTMGGLNSLPSEVIEVRLGVVEYKDFLEPKSGEKNIAFNENVTSSSLRKDLSFLHEQEVRILAEIPVHQIQENLIGLTLDVKGLFPENFHVITHPKMVEWKFKNVELLCQEHKIKLKRSELTLR